MKLSIYAELAMEGTHARSQTRSNCKRVNFYHSLELLNDVSNEIPSEFAKTYHRSQVYLNHDLTYSISPIIRPLSCSNVHKSTLA